MNPQITLEVKLPRENQYTPESAAVLFASLSKSLSTTSFFEKLQGKKAETLTLEIISFSQQIHFLFSFDPGLQTYFESQILASYPLASLSKFDDYFAKINWKEAQVAQIVQANNYYYPIKIYSEFKDTDPLSSLLAVLSKCQENDWAVAQYVLRKASGWQDRAARAVEKGIVVSAEERKPLPGETLIKQKIQEEGFCTAIRLAASSSSLFKALTGTFAPFNRPDGNSLVVKKPAFWQKEKLKKALIGRTDSLTPPYQILSVSELATVWHLPSDKTQIPNIAWGKTMLTEPPENLPCSINMTEEAKKEVNFFARTEFKNQQVTYGIKRADRRRHTYIIGKTGTGKSTLICNMAVDDMKKGQGVAIIDAHGDLSEILLDYIPSHRINDVCYLNPADKDHPFSLNILEVTDPSQAELITSGIVSIFYKLYANSWGPRLEHILRNTILTLALTPGSTLVDVPRILTDKGFRNNVVQKMNDPVLNNFWNNEFAKMPDKLREEAINPILNKVGQFITLKSIRDLIGCPRSTVDLEKIMNEGKILILNLSQGRLGEDNAALLGAMIITKFQLAAMKRVDTLESQRKDFFLYVDEFQNFATESFIKILSEARKYRLNLTLANQYMAQIPEPVQKAIFGNTGTLISFLVGSSDAAILEKEFGGVFTATNLVNLSNFQIVNRVAIDNLTSRPFFAFTLPLPKSINQNRQKVIAVSQQRYSYKK